jgi:hypothetical protein
VLPCQHCCWVHGVFLGNGLVIVCTAFARRLFGCKDFQRGRVEGVWEDVQMQASVAPPLLLYCWLSNGVAQQSRHRTFGWLTMAAAAAVDFRFRCSFTAVLQASVHASVWVNSAVLHNLAFCCRFALKDRVQFCTSAVSRAGTEPYFCCAVAILWQPTARMHPPVQQQSSPLLLPTAASTRCISASCKQSLGTCHLLTTLLHCLKP